MRTFETGATRNPDTDNLDFEGFESPLVDQAYAEYMHEHRRQADGQMRDSDNWQKGIPRDSYMKSMWRHFQDVRLFHDGYGHLAKAKSLREALCALRFNVNGMLFEVVKEEARSKGPGFQAVKGLLDRAGDFPG